VSRVEALLDGVALRIDAIPPTDGVRPIATHSLWICACVTPEDGPIWLIYKSIDGGLRWGRISGGAEASEVVDAHLVAGGHADPGEVLRWLQGDAPEPWANGGSGSDDGDVLRELLAAT